MDPILLSLLTHYSLSSYFTNTNLTFHDLETLHSDTILQFAQKYGIYDTISIYKLKVLISVLPCMIIVRVYYYVVIKRGRQEKEKEEEEYEKEENDSYNNKNDYNSNTSIIRRSSDSSIYSAISKKSNIYEPGYSFLNKLNSKNDSNSNSITGNHKINSRTNTHRGSLPNIPIIEDKQIISSHPDQKHGIYEISLEKCLLNIREIDEFNKDYYNNIYHGTSLRHKLYCNGTDIKLEYIDCPAFKFDRDINLSNVMSPASNNNNKKINKKKHRASVSGTLNSLLSLVTEEDNLDTATNNLVMEMVRPWHSTAYFTRPDNYSFNEDENKIEPLRASLDIDWIYGFKSNIINCVYYTNDNEIVYPAGAVIVFHDIVHQSQSHILGHTDEITCIAYDPVLKHVCTGQSSTLVNKVMKRKTSPFIQISSDIAVIKQLHAPQHGKYVSAVLFSPHGKYVASAGENNLCIWDWAGNATPIGIHSFNDETIGISWNPKFNHEDGCIEEVCVVSLNKVSFVLLPPSSGTVDDSKSKVSRPKLKRHIQANATAPTTGGLFGLNFPKALSGNHDENKEKTIKVDVEPSGELPREVKVKDANFSSFYSRHTFTSVGYTNQGVACVGTKDGQLFFFHHHNCIRTIRVCSKPIHTIVKWEAGLIVGSCGMIKVYSEMQDVLLDIKIPSGLACKSVAVNKTDIIITTNSSEMLLIKDALPVVDLAELAVRGLSICDFFRSHVRKHKFRMIQSAQNCGDESHITLHPFLSQFLSVGTNNLIFYDSRNHNVLKSKPIHPFQHFEGRCGVISPNGLQLIVGTNNLNIIIYEYERMQLISTINLGDNSYSVTEMKFNSDGSILAVACSDAFIYLLNPHERYKTVAKLIHNNSITNFDWSEDCSYIQATSADMDLLFFRIDYDNLSLSCIERNLLNVKNLIWQTQSCRYGWSCLGLWSPEQMDSELTSVGRSNRTKIIVSGDEYGKIYVHNVPCPEIDEFSDIYHVHGGLIKNIIFTSKDEYMFTNGSNDRIVIQWLINENKIDDD